MTEINRITGQTAKPVDAQTQTAVMQQSKRNDDLASIRQESRERFTGFVGDIKNDRKLSRELLKEFKLESGASTHEIRSVINYLVAMGAIGKQMASFLLVSNNSELIHQVAGATLSKAARAA